MNRTCKKCLSSRQFLEIIFGGDPLHSVTLLPNFIVGDYLKRGAWKVCRFKKGLAKGRWWCFWRRVDTPMQTMPYVWKFSKKHQDFGGLETNQRHEIQTWIFLQIPYYIWTRSTYPTTMIFNREELFLECY